jgi:DNA-binding response OmpR family regulator
MPDHKAILYVEDEPLLRELAAVILEDAGFEVVTADNGGAAFEALDDNGEPWCAVITDVNLGHGPDGWAVARHARDLNRKLPVVYITGGSPHQWQANGVPNSILITKPFDPRQIVEAIRTLLLRTGTHCN